MHYSGLLPVILHLQIHNFFTFGCCTMGRSAYVRHITSLRQVVYVQRIRCIKNIHLHLQHGTTYQQKEETKNNKKTEKWPPLPTARDRLTGQEIGGPPTPSKGILTVNFNILTFLHFTFFVFFYSLYTRPTAVSVGVFTTFIYYVWWHVLRPTDRRIRCGRNSPCEHLKMAHRGRNM
jgi:hypothetical protein